MSVLDQDYFFQLSDSVLKKLQPKEHLYLSLSAENSQFIRLNQAKIRQIGTVDDAQLELTLIYELNSGQLHQCTQSVTLCGLSYEDQDRIQLALKELRNEVSQLPVDPYAHLPTGSTNSTSIRKGQLLPQESAAAEILAQMGNRDIAGIYASGPIVRGMTSSSGHKHWFYTENFSLDYSLYTPSQKDIPSRAIKETFAGTHWNSQNFQHQMDQAQNKLAIMDRTPKRIAPGNYRCYLAPAAVSDLIAMMSWGCIGEASIQQGDSPLRKVRSGENKFSSLFKLSEDFRIADIPRFNSEGELAPEVLDLIRDEKLCNTLISTRTATEYKLKSNFADENEVLRAPVVARGTLAEAEILKKLHTGLYLSNLHYLNWSDQQGGRITGMTRYACFWVENGEIISPIENIRFDESFFDLFGDSLIDFTITQSVIPEVGSYFMRNLGSMVIPGMLVSKMTFTI